MTSQAFPPAGSLRVWDLPTRLFHWTLVAAVAVAFLSSEEDSALAAWHEAAGWVAGLLIVFRLVWGFLGGQHARFAEFLHPGRLRRHLAGLLRGHPQADVGHNPLGALAVLALLGLVAATVATGVLMVAGGGEDELHEAIGYGLLAMIGVHVVAVAAMSVASRENLVRAMITGHKPTARHPGATDARSAPSLALPVALVAVVAAAYGATRIDRTAFAPHSRAEASEHAEASDEAAGEQEADEREEDED